MYTKVRQKLTFRIHDVKMNIYTEKKYLSHEEFFA